MTGRVLSLSLLLPLVYAQCLLADQTVVFLIIQAADGDVEERRKTFLEPVFWHTYPLYVCVALASPLLVNLLREKKTEKMDLHIIY